MVSNGKDDNAFTIWPINNRKWEFLNENPLGILRGWRTSLWKFQSSGSCFFNFLGKFYTKP